MVTGLCVAFAFATSYIAVGRRVDVFAATTAYAAVQAVFTANVKPTCTG